MKQFDYDLFVIGAGSGGVRASRIAANLGARVAVAEERYLGGTCVNVGCVPKKLFSYAAHYSHDFEDARGFGWSNSEIEFDWVTLRDNKTREIERLNTVYQGILERAGVEIFPHHARIQDTHTIQLGEEGAGGRRVTAENILIATGGWPFVPPFKGSEHVITSNEAFYLDEFPDSIMVVGGGYIAVEFAGIFAGLGADTTLVYRSDKILRGFDEDIRDFFTGELQKYAALKLNTDVTEIKKLNNGQLQVTFADGEQATTDAVFYATGRNPKVDGLGLEELGLVQSQNGAIVVDHSFQSSIVNIYAVGDVIDRVALTPVALAEGQIVAHHLFGKQDRRMEYSNIPTAVFSQPNIASVGLTEEQARGRYSELDVYKSQFTHLKHTLSGRNEKTFIKMLVDRASDRVVGIHMAGADAGEIIQGMAVAVRAGATKADFDTTIGIHPTVAEEFVTMREPEPDR